MSDRPCMPPEKPPRVLDAGARDRQLCYRWCTVRRARPPGGSTSIRRNRTPIATTPMARAAAASRRSRRCRRLQRCVRSDGVGRDSSEFQPGCDMGEGRTSPSAVWDVKGRSGATVGVCGVGVRRTRDDTGGHQHQPRRRCELAGEHSGLEQADVRDCASAELNPLRGRLRSARSTRRSCSSAPTVVLPARPMPA